MPDFVGDLNEGNCFTQFCFIVLDFVLNCGLLPYMFGGLCNSNEDTSEKLLGNVKLAYAMFV